MKINNLNDKMKASLLMFFGLLSSSAVFAQAAAATTPAAAPATGGLTLSVNTVLCTVAVVLLLIIVVLAATVNNAIELYKHNKPKSGGSAKNVVLFIGFLLLSFSAFSQNAATPAPATTDWTPKLYFYAFSIVILIEVAIIFFFIKALRFLTGIEEYRKTSPEAKKEKSLWETINQFKPLDDEGNMDTGHNYDGIRELDNITPPWFTVSFIATIIFAMIYLYRYHVAHSAPMQIEEFEIEMKAAQAQQDSLLKLQGNQVDENSVAMLDAGGVAAGGKLFAMNCAACHGDKGQGGVGPNLTDAYWIHGGSIKDVFKSIKYGWGGKRDEVLEG
ncbi:MAG: cbb3-type cytochrome c oxidase N-terminal domain-containing protein [Chitinophagales bacterium]